MAVLRRLVPIAIAVAVLAGCGGGDGGATATQSASTGDPALDTLIESAQEEGELVLYTATEEEAATATAEAFKEKYGIETRVVRLVSAELQQRFSAEADSGATASDLVVVSRSPFIDDAVQKGWFTPLDQADLPGYPPKDVPKEFVIDDPSTAIVQLVPSAFGYNTDELSEEEVPKQWPDLLDPSLKGEILMVDPTSSPAYLDLWQLVAERYGIDYLRQLRAQVGRVYGGTVPLTEALAAGEGKVGLVVVPAVISAAQAQGAPLDYTVPDVTTGPELTVNVVSDAEHPNAARLFAHYLLTPEGSKPFNAPNSISPFDQSALPPGYQSPNHAVALEQEDEIYAALDAG